MAPAVTSSSPAIIRSAVVLPHPDGPTRTSSSPSSTCRFSDLTAVVPSGYCLVTESSTIRDMCLPPLTPVVSRGQPGDPRPGPQDVPGHRLGRELGGIHALPRAGQIELIKVPAGEAGGGGLGHRHREDAEQFTGRRVPADAAALPHRDPQA